jgi:hypothetical protein
MVESEEFRTLKVGAEIYSCRPHKLFPKQISNKVAGIL